MNDTTGEGAAASSVAQAETQEPGPNAAPALRTDDPPHRLRAQAPLIATAVAIAAAALLLLIQSAQDPYPSDLGGRISRIYTGATMQAYAASGPAAHAFQWQLFHDPEHPEIRVPYANHPPLLLLWHHAAQSLSQPGDTTLRMASLAWLVLGCTAFLFLKDRRAKTACRTLPLEPSTHELSAADPQSPVTNIGLFAAALTLSSAALQQHGLLACPPLFGLPPMIALAVFAARARAYGGRLNFGLTVFFTLIAALSDWNAYGLIAVILLDLLFLRAPRSRAAQPNHPAHSGSSAPRRLRPAHRLATGIAVATAVALIWHLETALIAFGGLLPFGEAIDRVQAVMQDTPQSSLEIAKTFFQSLRDAHGDLALILGALGLIILTASRFRRPAIPFLKSNTPAQTPEITIPPVLTRCLLWLWAGGLLAWTALSSRAVAHPFWVVVLTPAISLSTAFLLLRLHHFLYSRRNLPLIVRTAALTLCLAFAATTLAFAHTANAKRDAPIDVAMAAVIDRHFGPNDLLLGTDFIFASIRVNTTATILPDASTEERFHTLLDLYGEERLRTADRLIVLVAGGLQYALQDPRFPWLQSLPRIAGTERNLEGAPLAIGCFRLDQDALLATRKAKGRP